MTSVARQPRGIPTGGRFAPSARTEPSLSLSPGMTAANIYRRYTGDEMDRPEQRNLSRRLVQGNYDSGLLRKMSGSWNVNDVEGVLADAQDNAKLDAAIDSVVSNELRNPGTISPDTIGFQLCRNLLQARRAA